MKNILVPTDFSNNANNALRYANAFAKANKAGLTLLNVYTPSVGKFSIIKGIAAEETANAIAKNKKLIDKNAAKFVTTSHKQMLQVGEVVDCVVDAAKSNKADLIIMGTHGASGLKQVLFGSNTSSVIAKTKSPVLAIPKNYKYKKVNIILYATDLKNPLNELKSLIPIAKHLNAKIEIYFLNYIKDRMAKPKLEFEKKIKSLAYKKIKFVAQDASIDKPLVDHIQKHIAKTKPEMLAMFPEEKTFFDRLFISSKTEDLANHVRIPLLSIRKSSIKKG